MLQVYGCFEGWLSHSQVGRGIVAGLMQNGVELCIWNVAPPTSGYEGYTGFEAFGVEPLVDLIPDAEQAFYIGGYPPFALPWMVHHRRKAGLFITESSRVPRTWADSLQSFELVCVPSAWAREAYIRAGVHPRKTAIVHHGLHPVFWTPEPPLERTDRVNFLHVAGAASFLQRKGTDKLLEAWGQLGGGGGGEWPHRLTLRTPETPHVQALLQALPPAARASVTLDVSSDTWRGLAPELMRGLIADHHAVVQPSRAEAFGMVPLEARAVGRGVVMTMATGHEEHFEPTHDVLVTYDDDADIEVNGIPEGLAPVVEAKDVADSLRLFAAHVATGKAPTQPPDGMCYYRRWSWQARTAQLAELLSRRRKA
jgi:hypothetical protein